MIADLREIRLRFDGPLVVVPGETRELAFQQLIFSEKSENNEETLTSFGGLIIEVTIPQLLLESLRSRGFAVRHRQSFTILYTVLTTNEPA